MTLQAIAVERVGLVTSVGYAAEACCAAFRAKLTNPTQTRFIGAEGEPLTAHQVQLDEPWQGLTKLAKMAAMAIAEALADRPRHTWSGLPLLLCVAESGRPGRTEGLDSELQELIESELGLTFSGCSVVFAHGRVAVGVALDHARELLFQDHAEQVLLVAVDSLVSWPTLSQYEQQGRLLFTGNSNGFIPGEGAGALLVGRAAESFGGLVCAGIGFGMEPAHIGTEEPLRADGLTQAIKAALVQAQCTLHDLDFRIADLSGEHYYFKEATLALSRTLRDSKQEFDIWHPAECIGEVGAVAGVAILALAQASGAKGYARGRGMLLHMANDDGPRVALTMFHRGWA